MKKTPNLIASLILALALSFFWVLAIFFPWNLLMEVFSEMLFAISIAIAITWGPAAIASFRDGARDGPDRLSAAIFVLFITIAIQRAWSLVARWSGNSQDLMSSYWSAFAVYLMLLASCLFVLSPTRSDGHPSVNNRTVLVFCLIAGAVIALVMIVRALMVTAK